MSLLGSSPGEEECSRAGCTTAAVWRIDWRNPKIHAEGRVKTWLACDEHLEFLREFLAARSFPLSTSELRGLEQPAAESPRALSNRSDSIQ